MADKKAHKLIKPEEKVKDKPDTSKATTVAALKASVEWLYNYVGVK